MNNMKKLGLTALAGSLVAFSANAVEMSVSGSSELSYISKDGGSTTAGSSGNATEGNPFGSNTSIKFSGSGDVGFGTATIVRTLNDGLGAALSQYTTLDMGDLGKISFDSIGGSLEGLTPADDNLPTAYEEAWNGVSSSGIGGAASNNTWGYSNSFGPISVSLAKTRGGTAGTGDQGVSGIGATGSITDVVLTYVPEEVEGLTIKVGASEAESVSGTAGDNGTDTNMAMAKYSYGPLSLGYQIATVSNSLTTPDMDIAAYSIAFNVNDGFAVSYGRFDKENNATNALTAITEENTGISAAYTTGAATIRATHNESDNNGHTTGEIAEHTEISVVLAF
jgi:outer membrane protein OmpU